MLPEFRPKIAKDEVLSIIPFIDRTLYPIIVLGIRGYYLNSMGEKSKNDRGIYDDAIILDTPKTFKTFNANTDPSSKFKVGLATLDCGVYFAHNLGLHRGQYLALVQRSGKVTVSRDGTIKETGVFGINIHKGGNSTTGSLGCQTIPPLQWNDFIKTVESEAKTLFGSNWNKRVIPYILIEEKDLHGKEKDKNRVIV